MSHPSSNWAVLRQLVLATGDTQGEGARIAAELRLPAGFADPELAHIGLDDYVMPVGPQKFLEVVGPLNDEATINRWLKRVGGSGGYCLSVQVPDAPACKRRAEALGVRLAADVVFMGHPLIQLRPADVGILLELDGVTDPQTWFWDGITPGPRADALIDDILAVQVGTPDPAARASQWGEIIGLELVNPTTLDFSGCRVEFVEHGVDQLLAAEFALADGASAPASENILGLAVTYRTRVSPSL
ncbi:hypothetical protein SAMN05444157_3240 [Frankineae bacterium MT45]|nr:hypothetical protein SAMN05444157_3240 [Frankineae bacterium MT45]